MSSNLLQHLYGAYIGNYGIFFQKNLIEDDYVIRCTNDKIIPVKCFVYNTSVITEHYHERAVIRIFELYPVSYLYFFFIIKF